ncbi:MAG: regulatory protein RecX [Bryobacteraceae bacterium]
METTHSRRSRRPPRRLDAEALWAYAVKTLAGRAHSTGELRRKLALKAEIAADIPSVISRLRDYGYLNDKRFAENFAGARLENQGLGAGRVLRDLRQRQVASPVAESAVRQAYENVDEMNLIEDFIDRKLRGKTLDDPKVLASAYRRLMHAGFASGHIITVLKRRAKDAEALDSFEPPDESEAE